MLFYGLHHMIQYPGMGTKKKHAAEETKTAQDVSDWVDQAIDIKNLIHSLHKKIDKVTEGLDKYLRKQLKEQVSRENSEFISDYSLIQNKDMNLSET